MKRFLRWFCPALFLVTAFAVISFLQLFVKVDRSMSYVDWTDSVQLMPDGTEQPFEIGTYGNVSDLSGTYRFSGTLADGLGTGNLLFETPGLSLTVDLNGKTIWQSESATPEGAFNMAQAVIPLPENPSGTLSITCEVIDGATAMFPPLVRFIPEGLDIIESTAFANRAAFPSGAVAFALILVFGIFLLGVSQKHPDFSLIPLMLGMMGFIVTQLVPSEGYYFLPEKLTGLLGAPYLDLITAGLLLLYLLMNRRRQFWRWLGISALWSGSALLICFFLSTLRNGYLAYYLTGQFSGLFQSGYYSGLLYWITLWLSFTAAFISAYGVLRSFTERKLETQNLLLKNEMIAGNYQMLKEQMKESAQMRHEISHRLTALDCLMQKQDYKGVQEQLGELLKEQGTRETFTFTQNRTVNTILQYAAGKAKQQGVCFQTTVHLPEELSIPEDDLCMLLMNMLDNALEANEKLSVTDNRWVSIQIKTTGNFLAIKCENAFNGNLKRNSNGKLATTKDGSAHGFGIRQMEKIVEKYQSILVFKTPEKHTFLVETALQLPLTQQTAKK